MAGAGFTPLTGVGTVACRPVHAEAHLSPEAGSLRLLKQSPSGWEIEPALSRLRFSSPRLEPRVVACWPSGMVPHRESNRPITREHLGVARRGDSKIIFALVYEAQCTTAGCPLSFAPLKQDFRSSPRPRLRLCPRP